MDTLVCVKAITREPPRLRDGDGTPVFERASAAPVALNESDAYAIDAAVQLKKRHGGRVTAVSVGPLSTQEALYTAIAKGADTALRVDADVTDPLLVARLLAAVARDAAPDLILTGVESYEELASAVGPALAAGLDVAFATAVNEIEYREEERRTLVTRELGGGRFQTIALPLPAVLSVQSGICRLTYPPTVRVLQARRQRPRSVSAETLGVSLSESPARIVSVSRPRRERDAEIFTGTHEEIARSLLDRLEGVLPSP